MASLTKSLWVFVLAGLVLTFAVNAYRDDDKDVEKRTLQLLKSIFGGDGQQLDSDRFRKEIDFTCPKGEFLSDISSVHSNIFEDREWNVRCRKISKWRGDCQRSEFVNNYDGLMTFQCPNSGFITGVYSEYSFFHKDRRYKFDCCELPAYCTQDCIFSNLNSYDMEIGYSVPKDLVLRGVVSVHNNLFEDRRYSFMSCKLAKCWKPKRKQQQQRLDAQQIQN